ncbi:MAG: hypothetical protein J0I84_19175 [Terrimonas sp.]|nr:hypothetical protein [Terrimonas sp.]OJY80991.1 MAG: hypothetical protein BGP13_03725 [Sphingobacteriales bacterium 40-81]
MKLLFKFFFTILIFMNACQSEQQKKKEQINILKTDAVNTLRDILKNQQGWVKVHAAEFLIWTGNPQGVKEAYLNELELFADKPQYRIGIWRVLSQLSAGEEEGKYKSLVEKAFIDTAGKDRIHAIETMAKLKMSPLPEHKAITNAALHSDIKSLSAYTHWAVAYTSEDSMKTARQFFLSRVMDTKEDLLTRRIAAYVLRNSGCLSKNDWIALSEMVVAMPKEGEGRLSFLNAALLTATENEKQTGLFEKIFDEFIVEGNRKDKAARMDIAAGLAIIGSGDHLPLLAGWMHNVDESGVAADDADVQASAAYAILKIAERISNNN